jgi:DNA-binding GntR family transcriptional regulator
LKVTRVVAPVRVQAVEAIREQIISGELPPGQRLIERELCEQLDVSRNTLREACRQLEAEGFLSIPPHKGPIVAILSDEEAAAVFEVREAIECFAVRLFVERGTAEALTGLRETVGRLREAHDSSDVPAMLAVKQDFYDALYAGAGNDVLYAQARLLHGRLAQLRARSLSNPGRPAASMDEIEKVLEKIIAHDPNAASALWREHIHNAATAALGHPADGEAETGTAESP